MDRVTAEQMLSVAGEKLMLLLSSVDQQTPPNAFKALMECVKLYVAEGSSSEETEQSTELKLDALTVEQLEILKQLHSNANT